jgi:uncharacterized integral membrane protein (TIGR00698 family)
MIAAKFAVMYMRLQHLLPGFIASAVVATAASFLSEHYAAPVMLFALLLGMAMNNLSADGPCAEGIEWTARSVLRIGVALLGMRITTSQIVELGWLPLGMVVGTVIVTIGISMVLARALGFKPLFGLLTGGATAICGASAAMALSASFPSHPEREKATLFTVVGVSALSTVAMITYPMIANWLALSDVDAGLFLGGTIHDVAQVVGAGYSLSPVAGDTATIVKLMRVAMLLPVIFFTAMLVRVSGPAASGERPPILPWFAIGFIAMAAVNSTGVIPMALQQFGNDLSRWFLVIAISALGMRTRLRELASVGFKPVFLMVVETVFLALMVLTILRFTQ